MHPSALQNCSLFFEVYGKYFVPTESVRVIEIGSQDVNGSLRSVCPSNFDYIGVDFAPGKGVDVILEDPYVLPFASESADIVLSSSCFEHSEMFWVLFLEIARILKPGGLLYLNVPSNGMFHRYPVDCWRFYPDSGRALANWANRNGHSIHLVESFISLQGDGSKPEYQWNDFVAVFCKSQNSDLIFQDRIMNRHWGFVNGLVNGVNDVLNHFDKSQDYWKLWKAKQVIESAGLSDSEKIEVVEGILKNKIRLDS